MLKQMPAVAGELQDFGAWLESLVEEVRPDLIVAISRAAPRSVELFAPGLERFGTTIISELALAFLTSEFMMNRRVMIVDDSVVFGSTMNRARLRLRELGVGDDKITCAAYAVDLDSHCADASAAREAAGRRTLAETMRVRYRQARNILSMPSFHNSVVEAVRSLGKPYTIDYPVFYVPLSPHGRHASHFEWVTALESLPASVAEVSREIAYPAEITVLSVPLRPLHNDVCGFRGSLSLESHSKLRLYVDRKNGTLCMNPLTLIRWRPADGAPSPAYEEYESIWGTIVRYLDEVHGSSVDDSSDLREEALFRALNFLGSVFAFKEAWTAIRGCLCDLVDSVAEPELREFDCVLVFGPDIGKLIMAFANSTCVCHGTHFSHEYAESPSAKEYRNRELVDELRNKSSACGIDLSKFLSPKRALEENFVRLLLGLRRAIDEDRRAGDWHGRRLQQGFDFDDLCLLLEERTGSCTPCQLGSLFDLLIDNGAIVPVSVKREGEWLRVYRSGEALDSVCRLKAKRVVHQGLSQWHEGGGKPLSEFDLNKIMVILSKLFSGELPSSRHDIYGEVMEIDGKPIAEWAEAQGILDRRSRRSRRGRR
jgi:hypothetical protein